MIKIALKDITITYNRMEVLSNPERKRYPRAEVSEVGLMITTSITNFF